MTHEWNQPTEDFPEVGPGVEAPPAPPAAQEPAQAAPAGGAGNAEYDVSSPEPGVQMPHNRYKYPFVDMKVGDSFAVTLKEKIEDEAELKRRLKAMRSSLSSAASNYGRRNNVTLIVRKTGDKSFRCWRTA